MSSVLDLPLVMALAVQLAIAAAPSPATRDARSLPGPLPPSAEVAARVALRAPSQTLPADAQWWLRLIKRHGADAGLKLHADRVFSTSSGLHYVPLADERAAILALARDERTIAKVMAVAAADLSPRLAAAIGRAPMVDDLAVALVLGIDATVRMIAVARSTPAVAVAEGLPDLAVAYPEHAFSSTRARTATEMIAAVRASLIGPAPPATARAVTSTNPGRWTAVTTTGAIRR